MHRKHLVAAVAAVALAGTALGGPATAEDPAAKPQPKTLAKGLLSPLSLAVAADGTVFYSQNFAGSLHAKRPGKKPKTVYRATVPGTEVGAVSVARGSLKFATTFLPEEEGAGEPTSALMGFNKRGKAKKLADLWSYEEKRNPDGDVVYGLRGLPEDCEVSEDFAPYPGIVESHPYATAQVGGATYVADAAMNAIVKVGARGGVSTTAVLPAQGLKVTEGLAENFGMPECAVGLTYYFEPVPTDVEVGPDGKLYVTTLPGGPEDPSLGTRASVYKVNPQTGKSKKVASGLLSATGLAVGKTGKMFVAELFRGRIAQVKPGGEPRGYLPTALPGDVEIRSNGDIYATIQVLPGEEEPPAGKVIRIRR
jgi:hypothetical protein